MAKRTIEIKADKGQHLTLDEVAAWVQDAMRSGADGSTVVQASVSFGQKLQKISVTAEGSPLAASLTGVLPRAVEEAQELNRAGQLDWQAPKDAAETARIVALLKDDPLI